MLLLLITTFLDFVHDVNPTSKELNFHFHLLFLVHNSLRCNYMTTELHTSRPHMNNNQRHSLLVSTQIFKSVRLLLSTQELENHHYSLTNS